MQVTLSPDIEHRIMAKLRAGEFSSVDEIVEEAVSFFFDHDEDTLNEPDVLATQAAIEQGWNQVERGEGIALADFEMQMRAKYRIPR